MPVRPGLRTASRAVQWHPHCCTAVPQTAVAANVNVTNTCLRPSSHQSSCWTYHRLTKHRIDCKRLTQEGTLGALERWEFWDAVKDSAEEMVKLLQHNHHPHTQSLYIAWMVDDWILIRSISGTTTDGTTEIILAKPDQGPFCSPQIPHADWY